MDDLQAPGSAHAAGRPLIRFLGSDVYAIDTRMSGYDGVTAAYLIRGSRPCLVETGTATSAPTVASALKTLGVGPHDLASIVVTHVHLDHAGGAGDLAEQFPAAQVHAAEAGVPHLVDPARLLASARRVFGRVLDEVFGVLRPVPRSQVVAMSNDSSVDLGGGRSLSVLDAPGHARHHVGLLDSEAGDLYVGDAAGVFIPETGEVRPATPPPEFDLDASLDTLSRFRAADPTRLLFSHFGPAPDPAAVLERSALELRDWVAAVRDTRLPTGEWAAVDHHEMAHVVKLMRRRASERYAYASDSALADRIEHLNSTEANVTGVVRWLGRDAAPPQR